MLVQTREEAFRLIRQHDHGLLAGLLAGAWRAAPRSCGLPWTTVVAVSLHDVVWREEDGTPSLDPDTGRPHDFLSLPGDVRQRMLDGGLRRLERVEPAVGALVREHHDALHEGREATGEAAWVRFADLLSLHVCLTAPGGDPAALPGWLVGSTPTVPGGPSLAVTWLDASVLRFEPFPFAVDPLEVGIPFRDLPRRRYRNQSELRRGWEASVERSLAVRVVA